MASTTTPDDVRAAEQAMAAALGIDLSERTLEVTGPVRHVRVLEAGSGSPLLLVHGGGAFAGVWLPLIAHLPGRRVIAVDRPGCGLTDPFDYSGEPDLRAHAVGFLDGLLDGLGLESVDVVANSMGALWTLWLALDRPGRVATLCTVGCPAVVVGTSAPLPLRILSRRGIGRLMDRPQSPGSLDRVFRMLGHDPDELRQRLPGFLEMCLAAGNLPGAGRSFRTVLALVLRLRGPRPERALSDDELRTLGVRPVVVWGETDPFGDRGAARRFAEVTGGDLSFVGRGHLPWLDDPAGVAAAIGDPVGRASTG